MIPETIFLWGMIFGLIFGFALGVGMAEISLRRVLKRPTERSLRTEIYKDIAKGNPYALATIESYKKK